MICAGFLTTTSTYANKGKVVRYLLGGAAVAALTAGVAACTYGYTHKRAIDTANTEFYCETFSPITLSKRDSRVTQRQVVEHNAVWDAFCINDTPPSD